MIPRHERDQLEASIRGVPMSSLVIAKEQELNEYEKQQLRQLVLLRLKGIPLQYLIGSQEFYGREFYVNTGVLIPRPETEGLVELTLKTILDLEHFNPRESAPHLKKSRFNILDFGTGSGCIGITLALERPDFFVWATEASTEALPVAQENAGRHRVMNYETLAVTTPPTLVSYERLPELDLIVSNPPYLSKSDEIADDVLEYEPQEALFPPDGLNESHYYEFLAQLCKEKLSPHGIATFEIAHDRASPAAAPFQDLGFSTQIFKDLTNRDRYLLVSREK